MKSTPMPTAHLESAPQPTAAERQAAFAELVSAIMSERRIENEEAREYIRDTIKPPPGAWRQKRWVVIVSDDERVRREVTEILEGEQFFVRAYEIGSGEGGAFESMDAAFFLEGEKVPSLVAADAYLAELGCLEFFRELRAKPAYKNVPVVMLVRGDEMPAVPFIFNVSHPIDRVALLEFVHREATVNSPTE